MPKTILAWAAAAAAAVGLAAVAPPSASRAQQQPQDMPANKRVRLLVGFPAGSNTDLVGRVLADALRDRLGHPVEVENRAGAAGGVAIEAVVRAAPDGATLGLAAPALATARHVTRNLPYDPRSDLTPISLFATAPLVVLVAPDHPARDLRGLGEALRARPAACGTPGAGSFLHLATVLVMRALDADCAVVHYADNAAGVDYLRTGRIQVFLNLLPAGLPAVRAGAARPLAVASPERHALAPEVPAMAETLLGFEVAGLFPLVGPRGLPEALVERLERAAMEAARDPAVAARLRALGAEPIGSTRAELATAMRADDARWGEAARAAGLTVD